jgi:beta-lactamase family protein
MDLAATVEHRRLADGLPALAAAVVRSGGVETAVLGVRDVETEAPVAEDDRFHLGSNTKAITATVAALLVERGTLGWDTAARDVLEFPAAPRNLGEHDLLPTDAFAHLHAPHQGHALGWGVQEFEGAVTSVHSGSAETFFAVAAPQAERDLAVAVIANAAGGRASRAVVELTHELVRAA